MFKTSDCASLLCIHVSRQLSARWKEKSELIDKLEKQVTGMQTAWHDKEKTLKQERDKAVEAARSVLSPVSSRHWNCQLIHGIILESYFEQKAKLSFTRTQIIPHPHPEKNYIKNEKNFCNKSK